MDDPPIFDDGRIRFNQLANEMNDAIGDEKVWPSVVIGRLTEASIDVDPIGRRFLVPSADSVSGCGSLSDFGPVRERPAERQKWMAEPRAVRHQSVRVRRTRESNIYLTETERRRQQKVDQRLDIGPLGRSKCTQRCRDRQPMKKKKQNWPDETGNRRKGQSTL